MGKNGWAGPCRGPKLRPGTSPGQPSPAIRLFLVRTSGWCRARGGDMSGQRGCLGLFRATPGFGVTTTCSIFVTCSTIRPKEAQSAWAMGKNALSRQPCIRNVRQNGAEILSTPFGVLKHVWPKCVERDLLGRNPLASSRKGIADPIPTTKKRGPITKCDRASLFLLHCPLWGVCRFTCYARRPT